MHRSILGLCLLGITALPLACNSNTSVTDDGTGLPGGAGGSSGTGGTSGQGPGGAPGASAALGDPCSTAASCRPGLVCGGQGTCEFGRSTAPGAPCTASGECQPGAFCGPSRVCTPAEGSAKEGEPCESDGSCADGLRCAILGFAAACQPEGPGDLGKSCVQNGDCVAGLGCFGGVCGQAPPGLPPLGGAPTKSETCAPEEGPPRALFEIPRGESTGDFYRLPFPSDARTKDKRPDLAGHATPGPGIVGFDALQRYVEELQKREHFGAFAPVFLRFNTVVDIDSLRKENVVQYIDITPGAPERGQSLGFSWLQAGSRGTYICENWMGIRAAPFSVPLPGHTYAVLINKGPLSGNEDPAKRLPIEPSPDFTAMLQGQAPADPALAAAHATFAPLRSYLQESSIDPDTLLIATVYTVGAIDQPAEKIIAAASASVPTASSWVRCGDAPSPCPDATGPRACGEPSPDFDELHALISLPIFQQGTAPYLTPEDGGGIPTAGAVTPTRTEQVCLSLTVPRAAMTGKGWPLLVYAHGTGGHFRSHITEGVAASLARASSTDGPSPIAVLGIDQVQHGPRRNGSTQGPDTLFYNFANPAAALGNPLQAAADQAALGAFAASLQLPPDISPTQTEILFDTSTILFWGHSQGATAGGIAVPYSPRFRAAVFSGQGAGLADALVSKTRPQNIAAALPFALQDPEGNLPPRLYAGAFNPAVALLQAYIDPADPVNHARRLLRAPKEGVGPRHVFQVYGQQDSFSPRDTQQNFAMAAGLRLVASDPSVTTPDSIWGQPTDPAPLSGNFNIAGALFTGALRQYAPGQYDGHFVAFNNPTASADVVRFLAETARGKTPPVGAP